MRSIRTVVFMLLSFAVLTSAASGLQAQSPTPVDGKAAPAPVEIKGWLADPGVFPIAVWLQDPRQAGRYKDAGINLYVALWRGPTEEQLAALKAAGMHLICSQNRVGLAHKDDPTIVAWMHGDEPDNCPGDRRSRDRQEAVRAAGRPGPDRGGYRKLRAADPTRPIMLNLGQGVANDEWVGRGPGASLDDYPGVCQGGRHRLLRRLSGRGTRTARPRGPALVRPQGDRPPQEMDRRTQAIWNCIECTHIDNPRAKATPHQVKAEVWMSLVHGSRGLIYFVHEFKPKFNEHALLDDPEMLAAVTAINRQIRDLAPVLNSPIAEGVATVRSRRTPRSRST